MIRARRRCAAIGIALSGALLLAGCGAGQSGNAADSTSTNAAQEAAAAADSIVLTDGWAKSGDDMSGVFGTLENRGDTDLVLTEAESPAAGMVELHETATSGGSSTMREIEGGFTIPAGGSFALAPGGNHIMFMEITKPLLAGEEVPLTLRFADGSRVKLTVLVKDFTGAQEQYEGAEADAAPATDESNMPAGHADGATTH